MRCGMTYDEKIVINMITFIGLYATGLVPTPRCKERVIDQLNFLELSCSLSNRSGNPVIHSIVLCKRSGMKFSTNVS
jgi:hypothetical protein